MSTGFPHGFIGAGGVPWEQFNFPRYNVLRYITTSVMVVRAPPANRLEALRGDRKGQHSIRINDQWRICFLWKDRDAYNVAIVDYH